MPKIAIIVGTARERANGTGITKWLLTHLQQNTSLPSCEYVVLGPNDAPYPHSYVVEPTIAQAVRDPAKYESAEALAWSEFVQSCDAFIFVFPQYNWGYPGVLKNAIDRIFNEWRGKPALLVSYGGHGGVKAAEQLKQVLEGGCKMMVVGGVPITLPRHYIAGTHRVAQGVEPGDAEPAKDDEFLDQYGEAVTKAQDDLFDFLQRGKTETSNA